LCAREATHGYPNQPRLSIPYSNRILTDMTCHLVPPGCGFVAIRMLHLFLSGAQTPWPGHQGPIFAGHFVELTPVIPSAHRPCSGMARPLAPCNEPGTVSALHDLLRFSRLTAAPVLRDCQHTLSTYSFGHPCIAHIPACETQDLTFIVTRPNPNTWPNLSANKPHRFIR
jgi:hypothetical protein